MNRDNIVWAHEYRNEQYHGGQRGVPEREVLESVRAAAFWVFTVLYDSPDVQARVNEAIEVAHPAPPQHNKVYDVAIDDRLGTIEVAGQIYNASEVVFALDYELYKALGIDLCASADEGAKEKDDDN